MGSKPIRPLGKKYSAEILTAAAEPRSARELSERLDIPIATSYRRIDELLDAGLLRLEDRVRSAGGRRTKVYQREVDEITIEFDSDEFEISIENRAVEVPGAKSATPPTD